MKIFIITQEEPFYLPLGIKKLVGVREKNIIGATVLSRFGKKSRLKIIKKLFFLYGIKSFFIQASEFILFKILNILTPLIGPKRFYSVKKIFYFYSIPLIFTQDINDEKYLKKIKQLKPDIIISFACPQILKKELLSLPLLGCINVHGSLLPKYRGKNIGFWVLFNHEKETGVSVHYMNEKIDTGKLILQEKIIINPKETVHSLYKKIVSKEGESLLKALKLIEKNKVKPLAIKTKKGNYFSSPSIEDIKHFRALAPISNDLPPMEIPGITKKELVKLKKYAYRSFYLRPKYILKKLSEIRDFDDIKNLLRLAKIVLLV